MTASEVSEGKWRVYWKDSATGKRTTATVRAKSKLHAVREGLEHRRLQEAGAMSGEVVRFRQAASMVLESNSSRREVTRAQYEKNLRLYVIPAVGDQPIDAIDGQAIEREIAELSPATQKMVRAITKTIVRESMAILGHDCPDPFRFVRRLFGSWLSGRCAYAWSSQSAFGNLDIPSRASLSRRSVSKQFASWCLTH